MQPAVIYRQISEVLSMMELIEYVREFSIQAERKRIKTLEAEKRNI